MIEPSEKQPSRPQVLVTGASGFLGRRLCQVLVDNGYPIRVLLRHRSDQSAFEALGADIRWGDVRDAASLKNAICGAGAVVHAAAAQTGDREAFEQTTVKGTENVFNLCRECGVRRLVYISSMSVYQLSGLKPGSLLTEDAPLETDPGARGAYTWSKAAAERIAREAMERPGAVPAVILRPATVYGPGGPVFSPLAGISLSDKVFVILGRGRMRLPFVYIDNLVDAIVLSLEKENAAGRIFNVIDDRLVTKRDYVKRLKKALFPKALSLTLPYGFVYAAVFVQEKIFKLFGKKPVLTRYRLSSASADIAFSNATIKQALGWTPRVPIDQGLEACFARPSSHPPNK